MTIEITSIDNLTKEDVDNKREELIAFVQEKYPTIDISRGVFSTLILELSAIFGAKFEEELNRWKASRSFKAIEEDPTLADDTAVEHILSNYNVSRKSGAYATGTVTLVFSKNISYIVPIGYSLRCNDITFITTQSYAVYSSNSSVIDEDSLVLTPTKDGGYSCKIEVTAETTGSAGCIKKNSDLEIITPITSLVRAYAAEDFVGGSDTETNAVMLNRFKSGLATPCWGNKYNIESLIRAETSHILDLAVAGYGDVEMTRDQLTLFPVSVGGKTDLYVKTAPYSSTITEKLTANLQSIDGNVYTWSTFVPADILPGFWEITGIESELTEEEPDVVSGTLVSEGNYSRNELVISTEDCFFTVYQGREITFTTEPLRSVELWSSFDFNISLYGCPYIDEIHNIVTKDSLKPVSSDVIVRAPIPCDVYATIHLNYNNSSALTDEQQLAIQNALSVYINNTGFNQTLLVSDLIPIVQNELVSGQKIAGIQLDGIILSPNLKRKRISSNQYLKVPNIPSEGITSKITAYYTRPERVSFSYNTEI